MTHRSNLIIAIGSNLMNQEQIDFGTPTHRIIRTNAPDTSREAGQSVDTTKGEQQVYELISRSGAHGLTIKECARQVNKYPNQISGRFTGLKDKHLIKPKHLDGKPVRREKSQVMVVA